MKQASRGASTLQLLFAYGLLAPLTLFCVAPFYLPAADDNRF